MSQTMSRPSAMREIPIRREPIHTPAAWTAATLPEGAGIVALDARCLDEIHAAAAEIGANPLPAEALRPEHFQMPRCREVMAGVREALDAGVGFAIVDRLPVDELGADAAMRIYWVLMSMLGPPVAQKWDGTMLYDVTDDGKQDAPGNGVRSSKTRNGQSYHTDNAFNLPPDYVALLCLNPARSGGLSGLLSFQSVYNCLLEECPQVLERLYEPFWFDRQHEHAPGDQAISRSPLFEPAPDGAGVHVRLSRRLVGYGYTLAGEEMDARTRAAFDALCEIIERPALERAFTFERGQFQVVNNRRLGHRRTAYEDWPDAARRRHMVRIWVRHAGRPFYLG